MEGRGRIGVVNDDIEHLLGSKIVMKVQGEIRTLRLRYSDNSTEDRIKFCKRGNQI
jgi:hypothetical protein